MQSYVEKQSVSDPGLNIQSVLGDLPTSFRGEILQSMFQPLLSKLRVCGKPQNQNRNPRHAMPESCCARGNHSAQCDAPIPPNIHTPTGGSRVS